MTRAELRDWRVRAMGGETVPADVVLELICHVEDALSVGDCDDTESIADYLGDPGKGEGY